MGTSLVFRTFPLIDFRWWPLLAAPLDARFSGAYAPYLTRRVSEETMTAAVYDAIAEWYDESIRRGSLLHGLAVPALFALAGDVAGRRLCDLACGQGVVARQLAERGAEVIGIDLSTRLLAIARREEQTRPLGIFYVHDDAQRLATVADGSFDGVLCNLALMDIPDLGATVRTVGRILRPGGWFVFSITHPCLDVALGRERIVEDAGSTDGRAVRSYFIEGAWRSDNPAGVRGKVGAHHRMVSTYLNTLVGAGLIIECLREPQAPDADADHLSRHRDVPAILAVRCRKPRTEISWVP